MKNKEESKIDLILNDPDFIDYPKFGNSLKQLLNNNYGKSISDSLICKILHISDEELNNLYESALEKIKLTLK